MSAPLLNFVKGSQFLILHIHIVANSIVRNIFYCFHNWWFIQQSVGSKFSLEITSNHKMFICDLHQVITPCRLTTCSCRKLLLEFFTHLKFFILHGCPRTVMGCPLWDQLTPILRDVPGLSWDLLCGILRTPSHTNLQGHPRTVLGCPMWDPPDTKSHQSSGTFQDCPGMSHVGSSGHQVTLIFRDVPGLSWDVPYVGSSGHQVTLILRDVPHEIVRTSSWKEVSGQSWDVPHGIVWTSIYFTLEGCPLWDCPDITLLHLGRMSQDSPGMSLIGLSRHHVIPDCKDVPGQSWDV